jgi:hypothetical protein
MAHAARRAQAGTAMRAAWRWGVALALLLGLLSDGLPGAPRISGAAAAALPTQQPCAPGARTFPAVPGRCLGGRFLAYWDGHGGLAINGYPLTNEFDEQLEDGKTYRVQYFERVRMEYHPENSDPQYQVLLGQFGRAIHPADPPVAAIPGAPFFAQETGHNVTRQAFLDYWMAHGGLAQFGFPITEEFTEQLGDQQYAVQYFERARLEWHPENSDPQYQVLLGQFGRTILSIAFPGWGVPFRSVGPNSIQTIFVIVMENHNWADIRGSSSAPFINGTLLPQGAHAEQYFNPPGLHPSEPNYLWMEAGANFAVSDDADPAVNHQATTQHLVTQLTDAGLNWKSYQEGIDGTSCPLVGSGRYAPRHNPMIYFDDVSSENNPASPACIAHVRPFDELQRDLNANTVASYNFITPNLCNDMHDNCTGDQIRQGDDWLSTVVPQIQASTAYRNGGAIFITWDEGAGSDGPIGLIALSPFAKQGYSNRIRYTHSSLLRTTQTILGVGPLLCDAANATDLGDLFTVPLAPSTGHGDTPSGRSVTAPEAILATRRSRSRR